jgi:CheY-like chemotaxis protein
MGRKTVLVVDDDAPTRRAYAAFLVDAGFRVLEASNGGEAIFLVRTFGPDVVLMDVVMPVVGGVEAAESLREYPDTAQVPILAVTGSAGRVERARMRRACNELLPKPCSPELILSRICDLTMRG